MVVVVVVVVADSICKVDFLAVMREAAAVCISPHNTWASRNPSRPSYFLQIVRKGMMFA